MRIGIFDSGVGGLTVLKAIRDRLQNVDLVYVGDTARVPYGTRSASTIVKYSMECAGFLIDKGIDLLVIACNTASSYAGEHLRRTLPMPVYDVVRAGTAEVLTKTEGRVGVIGTRATIGSGVYQKILKEQGCDVRAKACPLLVPLVEEGITEGEIAGRVVEMYLKDLKGSIDTLLLGCTHYPLLRKEIERFMSDVRIVDSSAPIAKELASQIQDIGSSKLSLYFTDLSQNLPDMIKRVLGKDHPFEIVRELARV